MTAEYNGWIVVQVQIVGTAADWSHSYTSDMAYRASRADAVEHGAGMFGHDDFLIGHVRNGRLELLAWQDEDRDDPDELADAARQLCLTGGRHG